MKRILLFLLALGSNSSLLEPAREAFVKGDYKKAIQLAEPHTKAEPEQAWRLIGASSCFLRDKPGAVKAWQSLDEQGKAFLKYVCTRNGISLP